MIRVVLADDHEVVRSGFKLILEKDPQMKVVGEAAEGTQAYAVVAREKPDVLLLDLSMPPEQSGLVACEEISRDFPNVKIIILTMYEEPEYLYYTLRSGAKGYIVKSASSDEFLSAIHTVVEGGSYIHPRMAAILTRYVSEGGRPDGTVLQQLSPRELEILQLLAKGFTNREISQKIFLSVKTIEAHRAKIYQKLNFKTRADLVDFALKHKLLGI